MKPPSPFIPQGSFLEREHSKRPPQLKTVVLCVLAFHVPLIGGLLIQGCQHSQTRAAGTALTPTNAAPTQATKSSTPVAVSVTDAMPTTQPVPVQTAPLPSVMQPLLPPTGATKNYHVMKGDALAKIARHHGVSLKALTLANPGVDPARLRVGQVLQIPENSSSGSVEGRKDSGAKGGAGVPSTGRLYTVKKGDTLTKVAHVHGTTIRAICALNRLKGDQLIAGRTLKLPSPTVTQDSAKRPPLSTGFANSPPHS